MGYVQDFVRGTARALPFRRKSFNNVVSIGAIPIQCWGGPNEATMINEMIEVTRSRIIIWPSDERVEDFLGTFRGLKVTKVPLDERVKPSRLLSRTYIDPSKILVIDEV